jgi:hypothetical protein
MMIKLVDIRLLDLSSASSFVSQDEEPEREEDQNTTSSNTNPDPHFCASSQAR